MIPTKSLPKGHKRPNRHSMQSFMRLPDYISLANAVCGILAIFLIIQGNLPMSVLFVLMASLFDFLDGKVARKMNLCSEFGKQLDSFCDLISFIIAPAIIGYCLLGYTTVIYEVLILIFFIMAGILRLCRFNLIGMSEDARYFEGFPVPFGALIPVVFWACQFIGLPFHPAIFLFPVLGLLMISTIRVRKL